MKSISRRSTARGRHLTGQQSRQDGLQGTLAAQGQCRSTIEALATIKNPPVVFARRAKLRAVPSR
jgi:hypothetical protein